MSIIKYLFIFISVASLFSCNYSEKKNAQDSEGPGSAQNSGKPVPVDQKITFEFVKSKSLTGCLNCHSGAKKPDLTSLSTIQSRRSEIWHEVDSSSMPPAGSGYDLLSGCAKELLRKWIDLGAPEFSEVLVSDVTDCKVAVPLLNDPSGPPKPHEPAQPPIVTPILLMPLNYKSLTDRILRPKCLMCHSESGEESDMPFYPYVKLMEIERLWKTPGVESKIYKEITDQEDPMPPMDSKISTLTADEVEFVKRWIDAGKPEN